MIGLVSEQHMSKPRCKHVFANSRLPRLEDHLFRNDGDRMFADMKVSGKLVRLDFSDGGSAN